MTDAVERYESFVKELRRRFEGAYGDARPPIAVAIQPVRGEDAEITVRAADGSFAETPVLVRVTLPNAIEIAWEMTQGVSDAAIAKHRRA